MFLFFLICIILLNFLIQTSILPYIEIIETIPNTSLIIVVSISILRNEYDGFLAGLIAGLLLDLFVGLTFGVNILLLTTIGYFTSNIFKNYNIEFLLPPIILTFLASLYYEFGIYIQKFFFHGELEIGYYLLHYILPSAIITTIFSLPIYLLIYFINQKIVKVESRKRKLF